ncbi:MAG TPA: Fic family protein [Chloroflexota bacterium]|nr:Fic family protein [Chloroflexota bacterium]
MARSDRVITVAESALAAPAAAFSDQEFYPGLAEKGAVLCSHLVRNHPLPDGNKGAAYLCLIEFVERNGFKWRQETSEAEESEVVETMVRLAAGELREAELTHWVRDRLVPRNT